MTSPAADKCKLTLYHLDRRVSNKEWSDSLELSLTEQSSTRVNNIVSGFFQLDNLWDRRLFETPFSSDIKLDWFELTRKDSPDISCGIKIMENRAIVFNNNPKTYEALNKPGKKMNVSVQLASNKHEYDLSREDLIGERKWDLSLVALYNSESFIKYIQCSTNLLYFRTFKIIEPSQVAKL